MSVFEVRKVANLREVQQLKDATLSFPTTCLSSEKGLSVCHDRKIALYRPDTGSFRQFPCGADLACVHPTKAIIAMQSSSAPASFQVFDLDVKARIAQCTVAEPVIFFRWVNDSHLGIVTDTKVYHWSMSSPDVEPKVFFERSPSLAGCSIVNYGVNSSVTWAFITGLKSTDGKTSGCTQLFSSTVNVSQVLETTAACFADFTPEPGDGPKVTYFCLIGGLNKSLLIVPTEQRGVPKILGDTVATCGDGDFPVGVCALEKSGVIFVVTKLGLVGMYTLKGAKFLHQETCPSKLFLVAKCVTAERFLCLDMDGHLWSIAPHPPGSTDPITTDFNGAKVTPGALTADVSRGSSEQEPISAAQVEPIPPISADKKSCPSVSTTSTADTHRILELIAQKKICEAAFRVSRLAHPRSEAYIAKLRDIPATPPLPQALVLYLCILLDMGNLDEFESYELTRLAVEQGSTTLISQLVESGNKVSCSTAMGDILRPLDYSLSLTVYSKAKAFTKVFQILYERGDYDYIPTYTNAMCHGDIPEVLSVLLPLSTVFATKVATAILKDHPTELDHTLDCFTKAGCSREAQSLALDLLQGDCAEDSHIQTEVLRLAFLNSPTEAESLLGSGMLSHYDKRVIIPLCVEAGLYHLALQIDPGANVEPHSLV